MVVEERAVHNWFICSSADDDAGILTSPSAARLAVHLFTFILCSFRLFVLFHSGSSAFPSGSKPAWSARVAGVKHRTSMSRKLVIELVPGLPGKVEIFSCRSLE